MPITPGIPLLKDEILKRIREEDIFERYLGLPINTEIFYTNPLRVDKRAGCRFYYNPQGRLKFKDFSAGYNWDCFNVVEFRYSLSFVDSLRKIVKDFQLNKIETQYYELPKPIPREREVIQVCVREWDKKDLAYWGAGNIDVATLKHFDIYACKSVWFSQDYYSCQSNDPCYCFYFGNQLYKLYFPKRTEYRFFQNVYQVEDDLLQGWNQLPEKGDNLVITKSMKDVASLYTFGITSCAVLSETHLIKKEREREIRDRFTNIYTLFDHDKTGRMLAIKYWKAYEIPYLMFPFTMQKDWFDNVKMYGVQSMRDIISRV